MRRARTHRALALAAIVACGCTVDATGDDGSGPGGVDAAGSTGDGGAAEIDATSVSSDAGGGDDCPRVRVEVSSDSALNIREEPNTSSADIGSIPPDTVVTVLDRVEGEVISGTSEWFEIDYQGTVGFVTGAYAACTTETAFDVAPPEPPDGAGHVG